MTAQFKIAGDRNLIGQQAAAAYNPAELHQMPSGLAGYKQGGAAAVLGANTTYKTSDQGVLPKAAGITLLDGGRAFFEVTNQQVTFRKTSARDFLIGSIVGDAQADDDSCTVNLNEQTRYERDLLIDPRTVAPILTSGAPSFNANGNGILLLDATNEAQKIDLLSVDGFATGSKSIIEAQINVVADDSGTHAIFSFGVASGTHVTAFTSIANYLGIQVKTHDGKIYALCTGGSATDTTKTYAVGTRFEVWIDMRISGSCKFYIDGVLVLNSTTFDVSASLVPWFLLAHLVKAASTDTMQVRIDSAKQRQMTQ